MIPLPLRGDIRRILIIKWSALGDVAIASAIMQDIRLAFPNATIDLNTLPPAARFFDNDPRFAQVFAIPVRDKSARWRRTLEWLHRVRTGKYDVVIDLQSADHTRLLLGLLLLTGHRIPHRLSNRGDFLDTLRSGAWNRKTHVFALMRAMLSAAGIPALTPHPVLHASLSDQAQAAQTLLKDGLERGRFVVFMPGSQIASQLKRWGAERYIELGTLLRKRGVAKIAVIGGPDEVDECASIVDAINAHMGGAVNLNRLPLLQIQTVCESARCIVANDTGNAHIAAAADRPMLVICGPTDPRRVKPIGEKVRAIQAELACINCYGKTCRIAAKPLCMEKVIPDYVADLLMGQEFSTKSPPGVRLF